jgi:hypothetical protein
MPLFFIAHEGEHLVKLSHIRLVRGFLLRQLLVKGIDPVDDRLMINRRQSGYEAEAVAFDVKAEGVIANIICIA